MKGKEIRVHEGDPICLLVIIFPPPWDTVSTAEGAECEWKGKSKHKLQRPQQFPETAEALLVVLLGPAWHRHQSGPWRC